MPNVNKLLAGTTKAWRISIAVAPNNLASAHRRCRELGLQPKGGGLWREEKFLINVVVPWFENELGRMDSAFRAFEAEMKSFDAELTPGSPYEVDLICPPAPEKTVPETHQDGSMLGICEGCRHTLPVVVWEPKGGYVGRVFVMAKHKIEGTDQVCPGSGTVPVVCTT